MVASDDVCVVGGGGGGLDGGGGDFVPLPNLAFIRDDIEDEEIDEDVVVDSLASVLLVALVFMTPLSNGLIRSCGSKLVTGMYFLSLS